MACLANRFGIRERVHFDREKSHAALGLVCVASWLIEPDLCNRRTRKGAARPSDNKSQLRSMSFSRNASRVALCRMGAWHAAARRLGVCGALPQGGADLLTTSSGGSSSPCRAPTSIP